MDGEEEEGCRKVVGWSKRGRRTRLAAAENVLPPKKRKLCCMKQHRCNICRRCFSSYQALGGHKAHHHNHNHNHNHNKDDAVAVVHRCTFCYKVFSKGQALGGHRRHCQPPILTQNGPKIFTFDLNELPT